MSKFSEKAEKIFLGVAEAIVSDVQDKARHYSKDDRFSQEARQQYAGVSASMECARDNLHNLRKKIGKEPSCESVYEGDDYYEPDNHEFSNEIRDYKACSEESNPKSFTNPQLTIHQQTSSSSNSDLGNMTLAQWDASWINVGTFNNIDFKSISDKDIGLVKLILNEKAMYLTRAIDISNGAIKSKINELRLQSEIGKSKIGKLISQNYQSLEIGVLVVGNDVKAINSVRNLEREYIKLLKCEWI